MGTKFKRSFIGYKYREVQNQISELSLEYKKSLEICESQLNELIKENQKLKDEIQGIEFHLCKNKELEQRIEETIYKKFIEDCQKVYVIEQKYEEMVTYKKRILKLLEKII